MSGSLRNLPSLDGDQEGRARGVWGCVPPWSSFGPDPLWSVEWNFITVLKLNIFPRRSLFLSYRRWRPWACPRPPSSPARIRIWSRTKPGKSWRPCFDFDRRIRFGFQPFSCLFYFWPFLRRIPSQLIRIRWCNRGSATDTCSISSVNREWVFRTFN